MAQPQRDDQTICCDDHGGRCRPEQQHREAGQVYRDAGDIGGGKSFAPEEFESDDRLRGMPLPAHEPEESRPRNDQQRESRGPLLRRVLKLVERQQQGADAEREQCGAGNIDRLAA